MVKNFETAVKTKKLVHITKCVSSPYFNFSFTACNLARANGYRFLFWCNGGWVGGGGGGGGGRSVTFEVSLKFFLLHFSHLIISSFLSATFFLCVSVCLSVSVSVSFCLSVCLSVSLSLCLSLPLFIFLLHYYT